MTSLRSFIHAHSRLAHLLLAMALLVRAIVPAGYMVSSGAGTLTVTLCSGQGPKTAVLVLDASRGQAGDKQDHGKPDNPCAFSGLGMAALGGADPVLLAIAVAFSLLLAFRREAFPVPAAPGYLRPPLRAPPVIG